MKYILNFSLVNSKVFYFYNQEKEIEYRLDTIDEELSNTREVYRTLKDIAPTNYIIIEVNVEGESYEDFYRAIPVEVWL